MRGKMRFWSKSKHGEKKLSREKQASMSEAVDTHGKKKTHPSGVDLRDTHVRYTHKPEEKCCFSCPLDTSLYNIISLIMNNLR